MTEHMWVEFNYIPVTVELDPDTQELRTYVSEEALEANAETNMNGCWFCNVPLTHESFGTECPGSQASE